MGQKVHPTGIRLGIASDWRSKWYAEGKDYAEFLHKDLEVRAFLKKKLKERSFKMRLLHPASFCS